MILNYLCPPALLYTVFTLIYLILEISNEKYHEAFVKAIIGIIFICILQAFCTMNLGIISWILVMIPIIFYTYITLLFFFVFGLDPKDVSNNTIPETCSKPKPAPAPVPVPVPVPVPAPVPAPKPQPKAEPTPAPYPVPDPSHWVPSKHKSSTPIKSSLYTLSVISSDSWRDSPSYSPIIPDKDLPTSLDRRRSSKIPSNSTQPISPSEFGDYPGICGASDINVCSLLSTCIWNGSECLNNKDYQTRLNTLWKNCQSLDMNKCKNDKKCDFFDNICTPSLIGMADLFTKEDCIEINSRDYNDYKNTYHINNAEKEKKDDLFMEQSFKNIDTSGCGPVSLNIMETLYGKKM